MKLLITNDEENICVAKDFNDMNTGLMGQLLLELELIKQEVLVMYNQE